MSFFCSAPELFFCFFPALENILPGYKFFYTGRKVKRGGGMGIFVEDELANGAEIGPGNCFVEEVFEAIILKIPDLVQCENSTRTRLKNGLRKLIKKAMKS